MAIDPSLLDSACQANIDENFNRVLGDISTAAGGVLPELPAEDGTYTLKVTVAEGAATLSWVADAADAEE